MYKLLDNERTKKDLKIVSTLKDAKDIVNVITSKKIDIFEGVQGNNRYISDFVLDGSKIECTLSKIKYMVISRDHLWIRAWSDDFSVDRDVDSLRNAIWKLVRNWVDYHNCEESLYGCAPLYIKLEVFYKEGYQTKICSFTRAFDYFKNPKFMEVGSVDEGIEDLGKTLGLMKNENWALCINRNTWKYVLVPFTGLFCYYTYDIRELLKNSDFETKELNLYDLRREEEYNKYVESLDEDECGDDLEDYTARVVKKDIEYLRAEPLTEERLLGNNAVQEALDSVLSLQEYRVDEGPYAYLVYNSTDRRYMLVTDVQDDDIGYEDYFSGLEEAQDEADDYDYDDEE